MNQVMDTRPESLISYDHLINKDNLVDPLGRTFKEFKRSLKPRWGILWIELLAGHLTLIATMIGIIKLDAITPILPLVIILSALFFGYTLAYIQLFFHEAAHGNIAKNRKLNDILANILIGIFLGQDIKAYRPIHFKHHQKLGTPEDSERTYFDPLNIRFIIESLIGIKVIKVLLRRKKSTPSSFKVGAIIEKKNLISKQLVLGMLLHFAILSISIALGHWALTLAWLIGVGFVMPFFMALRQVLEHRDINAKSRINYLATHHGPIHRIFGNSLLARTLGGAGFNRHSLHHLEPQISYTQLASVEKFLLQTAAADLIRSQQTTYSATFRKLLRAS